MIFHSLRMDDGIIIPGTKKKLCQGAVIAVGSRGTR